MAINRACLDTQRASVTLSIRSAVGAFATFFGRSSGKFPTPATLSGKMCCFGCLLRDKFSDNFETTKSRAGTLSDLHANARMCGWRAVFITREFDQTWASLRYMLNIKAYSTGVFWICWGSSRAVDHARPLGLNPHGHASRLKPRICLIHQSASQTRTRKPAPSHAGKYRLILLQYPQGPTLYRGCQRNGTHRALTSCLTARWRCQRSRQPQFRYNFSFPVSVRPSDPDPTKKDAGHVAFP